ncbi:rRNA maturation RNase YbeY [candidate division WWE3 bacterium RIFCSPLOWO2_01_FULL_42_11]|uniref:rRNA maturation RNase YbeY n=1 Tax=candidate division WWE3 bacterium RIFCSPLOWO2_01_FULL_42_11 TaxID=1802627 RepID=A0A1F4VSC0_UNCKA|nr:MAG: rRNA maturation RNase YbeY [candidate division WWE3 bacterium RIFCSPLOWO2_01_FULL_42_11]
MDKVSASVSIVNDEQMQKLNKKYRSKDYFTDVLSFTINEKTPEGELLLGEIVINRDAAARQAIELGHSTEEEVAFLTAHAMMHLQGVHHEHDD